MKMIDDTLSVFVLGLSRNEREWLEERAGILEFEAGMPREEAEAMACRLTVAEFGLRCLLEE